MLHNLKPDCPTRHLQFKIGERIILVWVPYDDYPETLTPKVPISNNIVYVSLINNYNRDVKNVLFRMFVFPVYNHFCY